MSWYWDTSCILKLYCRGHDSDVYLNRVEQMEMPLISSTLVECELYYALIQKQSRDETGSRSAEDLFADFLEDRESGLITLLPVGASIYEASRELAHQCYHAESPVALRSLDGLHLATALQAGCGKVVTTDKRMRIAAGVVGLEVEDI